MTLRKISLLGSLAVALWAGPFAAGTSTVAVRCGETPPRANAVRAAAAPGNPNRAVGVTGGAPRAFAGAVGALRSAVVKIASAAWGTAAAIGVENSGAMPAPRAES